MIDMQCIIFSLIIYMDDDMDDEYLIGIMFLEAEYQLSFYHFFIFLKQIGLYTQKNNPILSQK